MKKVKPYSGSRDPRFVTVRRGGTLTDQQHQSLVNWAADCAEHVIGYFDSRYPEDDRPRMAISKARAWAKGEITMTEAREAAIAAHDAAKSSNGAASEAARSAGHAVATAHMADHELGASAYAIRAVREASSAESVKEAEKKERQWQHEQLTDIIRDLVLSDQVNRNKKFWSLFE